MNVQHENNQSKMFYILFYIRQDASEWSPLDICEAWALKRGYLTAKASRPDTYRAANELLRMALDGRLCLSLRPRGYAAELETKWQVHEETLQLNETIANVEDMAKLNKSYRGDDENDQEEESDDDDEEDDRISDDPDTRNDYRADFESTDDKDDRSTNDTDTDVTNKFNVLSTNVDD